MVKSSVESTHGRVLTEYNIAPLAIPTSIVVMKPVVPGRERKERDACLHKYA